MSLFIQSRSPEAICICSGHLESHVQMEKRELESDETGGGRQTDQEKMSLAQGKGYTARHSVVHLVVFWRRVCV